MSDAVNSLRLFLDAITARDIAEPLASFDDTTPPHVICAAVEAHRYSAVGIRREGLVVGWLAAEEITANLPQLPCHPFDEASIVQGDTPLNEVVHRLNSIPLLFAHSLGQPGGVITRFDIGKPAMRMWLFGLITITELRVSRMIDEACPNDTWQHYLSSGRRQKALDLQAERRRHGQQRSLLECLQIADKGRIVMRDARLLQWTQFNSKREVEKFVESLQHLRNNLAHAQDLSEDWDVICELATNLHRVVIGPATS